MWYQSTAPARRPITSDVCALTGSEFGELTFEYRPPTGVAVGVSCSVSIARRTAVEVLSLAPSDRAVLERFAVQLVSDPRTSHSTAVNVTCVFSSKSAASAQCCSRVFTVKDCAGAAFSDQGCRQRCASKGRVAPMQACGGKVVSYTSTRTTLRTTEQACCTDCGSATPVCRSVLPSPAAASSDIRLCVPPGTKGYTALLAKATAQAQAAESTTSLAIVAEKDARVSSLAATALAVAAVAAIVVVVIVALRPQQEKPEAVGPHYVAF
ncbi:hypothetical protein PINS_up008931 [Pythium insidiosum]|nr:hypothetical protein PINS_up008931 [Pythium insidiosum]